MKPYYQEKGITIYHADCREVLPYLEPVDLVLTDPPYGLGTRFTGGGTWGFKRANDIERDELVELNQVRALGRDQIIWGGNYYALPPSRGWLAWIKRDAVRTQASVEFAWTSFDMNAKYFDWTIAATNGERNTPH